jgi:hypothetical protein
MTNNSETNSSRRLLCRAALLCLVIPVGLVGCGGVKLAPVSGKVTCNGEAVKGGQLVFGPLNAPGEEPGRPEAATVQEDGAYTLKAGAKVGRHSVSYTSPPAIMTEEQRADRTYNAPPSPYTGLVPKPREVEVKPGENTINLELAAP